MFKVHPSCYWPRSFVDVDTSLSVLPLAIRMGGPREALWHIKLQI